MLLEANNRRHMESFGDRHVLTVRGVRETDFGNYSCAADNSLGRERGFVDVSGEFEGFIYFGLCKSVGKQFCEQSLTIRTSWLEVQSTEGRNSSQSLTHHEMLSVFLPNKQTSSFSLQ